MQICDEDALINLNLLKSINNIRNIRIFPCVPDTHWLCFFEQLTKHENQTTDEGR
jgi:hypothetical protein